MEINIDIETSTLDFFLLGTTPLIMNRMSEKVRQGLLLPPPKKNKAEQAATLKHNPIEEFENSVYRFKDNDQPTRLLMPAGAFKDAISETALRVPGATKTEISQLVQIEGSTNVPIYGIPQLYMATVRQAGMNKTPDIRTRALLHQWCCQITVTYVIPLIRMETVAKLVGASGIIMGVGDGRPEKGKLTFGKFAMVDEDDKRWSVWNQIVKNAGRDAQDKALAAPECADLETESLLAWYETEVLRRRSRPPEKPKKQRSRKVNGDLLAAAEALDRNIDKLEVEQ
jgi:hypothetical protein